MSPGYAAGAALAALAHTGLFAAVALMGPPAGPGTAANDTFTVTLVDALDLYREPEADQPAPPPEPEAAPDPEPQPAAPEPDPADQMPALDVEEAGPPVYTDGQVSGEPAPPGVAPSAEAEAPISMLSANSAGETALAPQAVAAVPATAGNGGVDLQVYMRDVRLQLARHAPRGVAGARTCEVEFHLSRSGEVALVKLRTSSGRSLYDRRCLRSVTSAAPFPEAPAGASPQDLALPSR